jgi:hypothetical protein
VIYQEGTCGRRVNAVAPCGATATGHTCCSAPLPASHSELLLDFIWMQVAALTGAPDTSAVLPSGRAATPGSYCHQHLFRTRKARRSTAVPFSRSSAAVARSWRGVKARLRCRPREPKKSGAVTEGAVRPAGSILERERQYEHIKEGAQKRGAFASRAKKIAARVCRSVGGQRLEEVADLGVGQGAGHVGLGDHADQVVAVDDW